MHVFLTTLFVFTCVFGGALLGMFLRNVLPAIHLTPESKETIKLGMGLVGTMAALVLGLLVAAAKDAYDKQGSEVTQLSAKILMLDRALAHYGPETQPARTVLKRTVADAIGRMWPSDSGQSSQLMPMAKGEDLYDKIEELAPQTEEQRTIKAAALSLAIEMGEMRWLMFAQATNTITVPFLVVVVFWITVIFISFGLNAPHNATIVTALFLCALAVTGCIFLIQEMYTPYHGVIQVSSVPLRQALAHLGQ